MKTMSKTVLFVIVVVIALSFAGCKNETVSTTPEENEVNRTFTFVCVDTDGTEESFEVTSIEKYVGDALLNAGLIAGEEGPYGLYVKTVNGITYDYEKDGKYWAFYIDGQYAMSGVDTTEIVDGSVYTFKAE